MGIPKGDYIGFTYNGISSSDLGIVRVSDGSRFNESLLPASQDKVVQVPGADGAYYFGSYYGQKQFNVSFAYDALSEKELANLRQVFGDKKIHPLVFEETPYKVYSAKVTGTASIKYIPFKEGKTNRIYKGEGSIQFTAYCPYAKAPHKFLDQYDNINKEEWAEASGMKITQGNYDKLIGNKIQIYNPGDIETDWELTVKFIDDQIPASTLTLDYDGITRALKFDTIKKQGIDTYVKFNSKTNLIEGYYTLGNKTIKSGNLYNQHITEGSFFQIPQIVSEKPSYFVIDNTNIITPNLSVQPLEYSYYYF